MYFFFFFFLLGWTTCENSSVRLIDLQSVLDKSFCLMIKFQMLSLVAVTNSTYYPSLPLSSFPIVCLFIMCSCPGLSTQTKHGTILGTQRTTLFYPKCRWYYLAETIYHPHFVG